MSGKSLGRIMFDAYWAGADDLKPKWDRLGEEEESFERAAAAVVAAHEASRWRKVEDGLPRIVCLCGSTRFMEAFQRANLDETLAGKIVLSIGCNTKSDQGLGITDEQKEMLDELHKRKIDLADEALILNVGGYIGESTRSELEYATAKGKMVRYLEPIPPAPGGE